MQTKFIRFRDDVKIPVRKHASDTGADIFMPEAGCIGPFATVVIPLGFGIEVPNGCSARMQVRTSIAKQGIMIQGCAIDAGYTGEISMIVHNLSPEKFRWEAGDRLGYIELYHIIYPTFVETEVERRGANAFGSTGK